MFPRQVPFEIYKNIIVMTYIIFYQISGRILITIALSPGPIEKLSSFKSLIFKVFNCRMSKRRLFEVTKLSSKSNHTLQCKLFKSEKRLISLSNQIYCSIFLFILN